MKKDMFYYADPLIFERAKELRHHLTNAEMKLWGYLRSKLPDYKFRQQHPIGPFIAGFYCHAVKLADEERQRLIEIEGIQVIRFTNNDIANRYEEVIASINTILTKEIFTNLPFRGLGGRF